MAGCGYLIICRAVVLASNLATSRTYLGLQLLDVVESHAHETVAGEISVLTDNFTVPRGSPNQRQSVPGSPSADRRPTTSQHQLVFDTVVFLGSKLVHDTLACLEPNDAFSRE